jgi:hypothetical protein
VSELFSIVTTEGDLGGCGCALLLVAIYGWATVWRAAPWAPRRD